MENTKKSVNTLSSVRQKMRERNLPIYYKQDIAKTIWKLSRPSGNSLYFHDECFTVLQAPELLTIYNILSYLYVHTWIEPETKKINCVILSTAYSAINESCGRGTRTIDRAILRLNPYFIQIKSHWNKQTQLQSRFIGLTEYGRLLYETMREKFENEL